MLALVQPYTEPASGTGVELLEEPSESSCRTVEELLEAEPSTKYLIADYANEITAECNNSRRILVELFYQLIEAQRPTAGGRESKI